MRHCQSVLDSVSANGKHKKEKEKNLTTNIIFYSISAVCDIYRLQFKQHEPTKIHSNTSYGESEQIKLGQLNSRFSVLRLDDIQFLTAVIHTRAVFNWATRQGFLPKREDPRRLWKRRNCITPHWVLRLLWIPLGFMCSHICMIVCRLLYVLFYRTAKNDRSLRFSLF